MLQMNGSDIHKYSYISLCHKVEHVISNTYTGTLKRREIAYLILKGSKKRLCLFMLEGGIMHVHVGKDMSCLFRKRWIMCVHVEEVKRTCTLHTEGSRSSILFFKDRFISLAHKHYIVMELTS